MKAWLEGWSTFTVDFFPTVPALQPTRDADYLNGGEQFCMLQIQPIYSTLSSCFVYHIAAAIVILAKHNFTSRLLYGCIALAVTWLMYDHLTTLPITSPAYTSVIGSVTTFNSLFSRENFPKFPLIGVGV